MVLASPTPTRRATAGGRFTLVACVARGGLLRLWAPGLNRVTISPTAALLLLRLASLLSTFPSCSRIVAQLQPNKAPLLATCCCPEASDHEKSPPACSSCPAPSARRLWLAAAMLQMLQHSKCCKMLQCCCNFNSTETKRTVTRAHTHTLPTAQCELRATDAIRCRRGRACVSWHGWWSRGHSL